MTEMVSELRYDTATAKKTKVTVTATPLAAAPWVGFAMAADYPDKGGKQDGDKLKFDAGAGEFDLSFELDDQTALNLAFYPSPADAIWVAVGTTCPTQAGNGDGAITAVSATNKKLVVTNANSVPQTLTFALRFSGIQSSGNYPPYVYDPEIVNGGGRVFEDNGEDDDDRGEQGEWGKRED
jgi:hypothetical protein